MEQPDERGIAATLRGLGPYLTMGIQLAVPVVVFFFLGRWLDGKWNSSPWGMIGGIVLGGAGGMIKFITSALKLSREQDAIDAEHRAQKKV